MRPLILCLAAFFCFNNSVFSQGKVSDKAVIKTPEISCDVCKDRVEFYISKEYGVTSVTTDTKKHTMTVTWLRDRTTLENIKVAIANLGFDADDIEAEEYAYKRLPKECKKTVIAPKAAVPTKE